MPRPNCCWHHIIINAFGSWLTGDPRGFHSRNHRLDSHGDYKKPPPPGEHQGLHKRIHEHSRSPVTFPTHLHPVIGEALLSKIQHQKWRILVLSVDAHHAHLLVELPDDRPSVKQLVGQWKQAASHAVREVLPGTIWSKSCDPIRIRDRAHQIEVYRYILRHKERGAWVWDFQQDSRRS